MPPQTIAAVLLVPWIGRWCPGPGLRLFSDLKAALGALPFLAEDLGELDASVHELRRACGFPGMRVLQFAFDGDAANLHLPSHHDPECVVFTGTHDNPTTRQWWSESSAEQRAQVCQTLGVDGSDIVWDLIAAAFHSPASLAIVPLQDVLALDERARMNVPGVASGNWSWRVREAALTRDVAARLAALVAASNRG